ncbi:MAG: hypothetical protein A3C46_01905 [Deltaproteobacteria bacterium RIFCSPHIGHO2_02_FULL_44_16]|nr:MAG: hypothetical protein A3C46_01905 [Deltaproteobacteria bacterium RIFCSPHIGHO2_02_FULL_44_16]
MKTVLRLFLPLFFFVFLSCSQSPSGQTFVRVNGQKITEGDLGLLAKVNPRIQVELSNQEGKQRILENLVEQKLLYNEAVRQGLHREKLVKAKADLYRRVIIAQSLLDAEVEKAAQKYYKENTPEFQKLELAHIMIRFADNETLAKTKAPKQRQQLHTEQEAQTLIEKIRVDIIGGKDFTTTAQELSEDVSTKTRGGSLGKVSKNENRLVSRGYTPLLEKAFQMNVGDISEPIKTEKAFHLVTVTKGVVAQTFEEVSEELTFKFRTQARTDLLARLKKDAKIEYANKIENEAPAPNGSTPPVPQTPAHEHSQGDGHTQ